MEVSYLVQSSYQSKSHNYESSWHSKNVVQSHKIVLKALGDARTYYSSLIKRNNFFPAL